MSTTLKIARSLRKIVSVNAMYRVPKQYHTPPSSNKKPFPSQWSSSSHAPCLLLILAICFSEMIGRQWPGFSSVLLYCSCLFDNLSNKDLPKTSHNLSNWSRDLLAER